MYMEVRKWINVMMTVTGIQVCLFVIWGKRVWLEICDEIFVVPEEFLTIESENKLLLFLIVLVFLVINCITILILKNMEKLIRFELNNVNKRISEIER